MSVERLEKIVGELEALRDRLGQSGLEPGEATEVLERISGLAQEVAGELEARAAAAEGDPRG
jgi:hypothetical protein